MNYNEMITIFSDNGVNLIDYAEEYGLRVVSKEKNLMEVKDRSFFPNPYEGRIGKMTEEEEKVFQISYTVYMIAFKRYYLKYRNKKDKHEPEYNKKIRMISDYCYHQITGYRGFVIHEEDDRETWETWLTASQITVNGPGKRLYSWSWADSKPEIYYQNKKQALEHLRKKIDVYLESEEN